MKSQNALNLISSLLSSTLLVGAAAANALAQRAAPSKPPVIVINQGYRLLIASERGTIASFRSTFGIDRDLLIPNHANLPLFKIEFLNKHAEFKTVTSSEAQEVKVGRNVIPDGQIINLEYKGMGGLPVDARVTITLSDSGNTDLLEPGS